MKEDLELLIKEKGRKQDEFATLVADIEKLPSTKDIKVSLNQGKNFIKMYKTFFENHHACWLKEVLLISI